MKSSTACTLAFSVLASLAGSFILAGYVHATYVVTPVIEAPVTEAAVVQVSHFDGHGSGVRLDSGVVITAAHILKEDMPSRIGDEKVEVLWANKEYDIAALRTKGSAPGAQLRCTPPKIGESLHAFGYPAFFGLTQTLGRVAGKIRQTHAWRSVFVADLTIYMGNSGGPAFDKDGRIVAIVVGWMEGTGFALLVPSIDVCKLLGR